MLWKWTLLRILIWSCILTSQLTSCNKRLKVCGSGTKGSQINDGAVPDPIVTITPSPRPPPTTAGPGPGPPPPPPPPSTPPPPPPPPATPRPTPGPSPGPFPGPGDYANCPQVSGNNPYIACGGVDVVNGRGIPAGGCFRTGQCLLAVKIVDNRNGRFEITQTGYFKNSPQWPVGIGTPCFGINVITSHPCTKTINVRQLFVGVAIFPERQPCRGGSMSHYVYKRFSIPKEYLIGICKSGHGLRLHGTEYRTQVGFYPPSNQMHHFYNCPYNSFPMTWQRVKDMLQTSHRIFKDGPFIANFVSSYGDSLCPLSGFSDSCHRENKRRTVFRRWLTKPKDNGTEAESGGSSLSPSKSVFGSLSSLYILKLIMTQANNYIV